MFAWLLARPAILAGLVLCALLTGIWLGEHIGYVKGFEVGGVDGFADGVRYADQSAREGDCH